MMNNQKTGRKWTFIGLTLVVLSSTVIAVISCSNQGNQLLSTLPIAEKQRSHASVLRTIQSDWVGIAKSVNSVYEEDWSEQKGSGSIKKIHFSPNKIMEWEEDYYYTGRKYLRGDNLGYADEYFTVYFNYLNQKCFLKYVGEDQTIRKTLDSQLHLTNQGYDLSTQKDPAGFIDQIFQSVGLSLGQ